MIDKNQKKFLELGIVFLIVWFLYVTFIYLDSSPDTMENDCNARNPNMAQTKSICLPKIYTTFGWMG